MPNLFIPSTFSTWPPSILIHRALAVVINPIPDMRTILKEDLSEAAVLVERLESAALLSVDASEFAALSSEVIQLRAKVQKLENQNRKLCTRTLQQRLEDWDQFNGN